MRFPEAKFMVFMAQEVAKNGRTSRRHHRTIRAGDLAMATQLQTNGPGVAGAFQWLLHEVNLGQAKIGMNPSPRVPRHCPICCARRGTGLFAMFQLGVF